MCVSIPPSLNDDVSIPITVNLDQDVTVKSILLNDTLIANNHTLTLTATEPLKRIFGFFQAGTSTVKISDADHTFNNNMTLYNLQWATSITAPRAISIWNSTITIATGGAFNLSGSSSTNKVTFTGNGSVSPPVTLTNCTSRVQGITCTAAGGGGGSGGSGATGQTLTFNALPNKTFGDAPFTLSATASSGLAVAYAATGNCTVAGATVTLTGVGSCTITASQSGNGSYLAATEVVQTFKISEKVSTPPSTPSTPPLPAYLGLFLQVDGRGHGKVTTDTGLSCQSSDCQVDPKTGDLKCNPQNCMQLEKTGSDVTLTPQADADSVFSSWGGNEDCVDGKVFMNSGKLCIAFFRRIYSLTVATQGPGQVTGYGDSNQQSLIECGTTCQTSVSEGMRVSLQATPSQGMTFSGWSGDCGNTTQTPLTVEVNQEMKCLATFAAPAPPKSEDLDSSVVPTTPAVTTPVDTTTTPVTTTPVTTTPVTVTTETSGNVPATSPVAPVTTTPVETTPVETTPVTTPVTTPPVATTTPAIVTTPAPTTDQVPANPTPPTPTPGSKSEDLDSKPVAVTPGSKSEELDSKPVAVTPPPVVTVVPTVITGVNYSCETTGNIGEVCNYGGRAVTNLNVQTTGIVSNGLVTTTVVNTGWVSNFHITTEGQLRGGVVTGYIVNEGVMCDFDFKGMSLSGGKLCGNITNTSRVGGYFQDVTLKSGTKITGGILSGIITGDKNQPAILENVRVKGRSKLSGVKLGKGVVLEKGVVVEK